MFVLNATFHLWDLGLREQFDFIPDEHKSLGPRTAAWYPTFRAAVPEPMRTIMPPSVYARDDKTFLPLQAADMVAGLERMEREDNSSLAWLKLRLARLYHERRTIHINAESYARDRAVYQALNSPLAPDAVDEIQRLMGFPIKGPDGEQEP